MYKYKDGFALKKVPASSVEEVLKKLKNIDNISVVEDVVEAGSVSEAKRFTVLQSGRRVFTFRYVINSSSVQLQGRPSDLFCETAKMLEDLQPEKQNKRQRTYDSNIDNNQSSKNNLDDINITESNFYDVPTYADNHTNDSNDIKKLDDNNKNDELEIIDEIATASDELDLAKDDNSPKPYVFKPYTFLNTKQEQKKTPAKQVVNDFDTTQMQVETNNKRPVQQIKTSSNYPTTEFLLGKNTRQNNNLDSIKFGNHSSKLQKNPTQRKVNPIAQSHFGQVKQTSPFVPHSKNNNLQYSNNINQSVTKPQNRLSSLPKNPSQRPLVTRTSVLNKPILDNNRVNRQSRNAGFNPNNIKRPNVVIPLAPKNTVPQNVVVSNNKPQINKVVSQNRPDISANEPIASVVQKNNQIQNEKYQRQLQKGILYLQKKCPTALLYLPEQSVNDIAMGCCDINNTRNFLSDYSALLTPLYRGLEYFIFVMQQAKGINVKMIGQAYERPDGNYILKSGYRKKIDSLVYQEVMATLYTEYFEKRNYYLHSDYSNNSIRVINESKDAKAILENLLSILEYNCKKLKETGFLMSDKEFDTDANE